MELLYKELTEKIIKALFEVFNNLGPGLSEIIYKRAVTKELKDSNLKVETEKDALIYYKKAKIGSYRLDMLIENKVILELKVKSSLEPFDDAQILGYLRSTGYRIGLLVNFGSKKLEFKRFIV